MKIELFDLEFTKQKVITALKQVEHLKSAEFPYTEPKSALERIELLFKEDLIRLDQIDSQVDPKVRQKFCALATMNVARYHDRLGFILRSTNVRNAFEVYDPLLRVCKSVYGNDAKLILSSEWNFSPFTYPMAFNDLPDLMFIGLPATEAENSLIVPLAGHELGHSVWRMPAGSGKDIRSRLEKQLYIDLTNIYTKRWKEFQSAFNVTHDASELNSEIGLHHIWSYSLRLSQRQIEEIFCDLLGLRLFGEGFLYSFLYLVSPSLGERANHYPSMAMRVDAMEKGCAAFGIGAPPLYGTFFSESAGKPTAQDAFILSAADEASSSLINAIVDEVGKHVANAGTSIPADDERNRIHANFLRLTPAPNAASLADVINAGWAMRQDFQPWSEYGLDANQSISILNDLVFKTLEVMEYETRIG